MAIDKKLKGKLSEDMIDDWLCSTGYLYPLNEMHLRRFDLLYNNYDFKLSNAKINIEDIFNGTLCKFDNVKLMPKQVDEDEIAKLRMVARKGAKGISKEAEEKLKANHKKGSGDKE
ncbi:MULTISPECIES: hypothetical protein [unclassified Sphingobacterium]|uniref:hypothetical protein n=1 Tax=unclassified Sphingobacterium TaxID=2609468 RepID=UPI0010503E5D|nr:MULTISPECIES: hypothetical protein [unclassified Sphingobacterium]MCS3557410.1 hypothetical protein [Sphingobacterium sp. JUb21]TCQ96707.1 hypothetical protein EDF66_12149 [Sphingobacterium sp. JUb20]